jgi:hypothetical protein
MTTWDKEFQFIALEKELQDLKDLLEPLAPDNKKGVALIWGSDLQLKISKAIKK